MTNSQVKLNTIMLCNHQRAMIHDPAEESESEGRSSRAKWQSKNVRHTVTPDSASSSDWMSVRLLNVPTR